MEHSTGNPAFDRAEIRRILESPEGQSLLNILSRDQTGAIQQVVSAWQSGNTEQAKRLMAPLLASPETAQLVKKLLERQS